MIHDRHTTDTNRYTFGPLTFTVTGLGQFYGGPKLDAKVAALTPAELKEVNADAWKQKRAAARQADRYSNITIHGNYPYDMAAHRYSVAEAVCKATWKEICSRTGR